MFRYRFLRISFFLTLILVILLPLYAVFFTHPAFRSLLIEYTEANAVRVANHLASDIHIRPVDEHPNTYALEVPDDFKAEADHIAKDFRLYKYRLFDAHGKIILSSSLQEVGKINEYPYFHTVVAEGNNYSLTVQKDQKTLENEVLKIDVVETYVPIMRDKVFMGAFEIYFDITQLQQKLERVVHQSTTVLVVISLTFFLVVFSTRFNVMRRVGLFMQAISGASSGDFGRRVPLMGNDELTDMAASFNAMSEELHKLHTGLQNEKNKLTTIILSAREGIVVTNSENHVVLVNPAAERLLGKVAERIQREGFDNLVDDPGFVRQFLEREGVDMPEILLFNNSVLHFYASSIRDREGNKIGSAALMRDITDEKKLEERLRNLSITDALTGLFNRRHTDELIDSEIRRCERMKSDFAFLLLDVDHFKRFNDQYGHDQGDRVLQAVARAMRSHFRAIDSCCRYGGEEFCVIMPGASSPGAYDAANRLRQKIEAMEVDGLKVTVSIGVSLYPYSAVEHEPLFKRADDALYEAKHNGRNQVVIHETKKKE